MKKGIAMLLALTMAFGMTACSTGSSSGNGSNSGNGSGSGNADATTTQAVENNEAPRKILSATSSSTPSLTGASMMSL